MARLIAEYEPNTVAELKTILATLPGLMPITDSLGEMLCVQIFEDESGDQTLEFQ